MAKLTIVLCAYILVSAANGASWPRVELVKAEAEVALAVAEIIRHPEKYTSHLDKEFHDINEVFAASLWEKSRDFLLDDNLNNSTKEVFYELVNEIAEYMKDNLDVAKKELEICHIFESTDDAIPCYERVTDNAYEIITKRFPDLNKSIEELLKIDIHTNCLTPHTTVPIYVRKH